MEWTWTKCPIRTGYTDLLTQTHWHRPGTDTEQTLVIRHIFVRCHWQLLWRDVTWPDVTWRDVTWRDLTWRDLTWPDLTWRDVMWCSYCGVCCLPFTQRFNLSKVQRDEAGSVCWGPPAHAVWIDQSHGDSRERHQPTPQHYSTYSTSAESHSRPTASPHHCCYTVDCLNSADNNALYRHRRANDTIAAWDTEDWNECRHER